MFLLIFNLENIISQVAVGERSHSIIPSLPVRHLDPPGEGTPISKRLQERSSENLHLIPKGDLYGCCSSFIRPLKDTA